MGEARPNKPAARSWAARLAPVRRLVASTGLRLALLYAGLFSAAAAAVLLTILWTSSSYMTRQTEASIAAEIELLAERYRANGLRALVALIEKRIRERGQLVYVLTGPLGEPLAGNLRTWPRRFEERNGWLSFEVGETSDPAAEKRLVHAKVYALQSGFRLLVGRDIQELVAIERQLGESIAIGLLAALGLGLAGSAVAVRATLHRVETIHRTCGAIMDGDLSRRIPTRGTHDDFDQLAISINRMVARIENTMDDVRRVSDNIAHDLRTPLTRLRSRLEDLQARAEDGAATDVAQALNEVDGLLATFNALLRIARVERGDGVSRQEGGYDPIDLRELCMDAIDMYEPLAEAKEMRIAFDAPPARESVAVERFDRNLLFQMVVNVLDNAVKFGPPRSTISVALGTRDGVATLTIADQGPGISPADKAQVFDRFYRAEAARSTPGNGLGLSLVAAIAKRFPVRISLDDADPGLIVQFTFDDTVANAEARTRDGYSAALATSSRAPV